MEYADLGWCDMRYGQLRHISLGGVVGELYFSTSPSLEAALRFVWGQYFGAGKNPRFGLGFWRIPEIALKGGNLAH